MSGGASLGEELRSHRIGLRLTQAELAERAGISERAVSDIERGLRRVIYKDTLRRLIGALELAGEESARFEAAALGRDAAPEPALPVAPRPIFGRAELLADLEQVIADPATRILSLTGPGGVGKTRVALELARRLEPQFPDGVFFVPLGDVQNAALALPRIAGALRARGDGDVATAVAKRLRGKRSLVVLDTLEHLLEIAPDVAAVAARCQPAVLLLTTRVALNVAAERSVALPPLGPEAAVAMFESCLRSAQPVEPAPAEEAVAGEICLRVDRLPLAIELAAARARMLGVAEILGHLERRLPLLTGGPVDLPERQRSMAATIEWSYALLGSQERLLLEQLSVFAGGWTLAAAEHVCDRTEIVGGLGSLVDASLVQFEARAAGSRYRLLDTVREYASERLVARGGDDGVLALQRRHAEHFVALAEAAEPHLRGAEQAIWLRHLRDDADNLAAALDRALQAQDADTALRLCGSLWMFWRLTGAFREGHAWLRRALELDATGQERLRAGPLWGAGWLAYQLGDYDETAARGRELETWARAAGDLPALRNGVTVLGQERLAVADYSAAARHFEEALALAREVGAPWLVATSCLNRSVPARETGDLDGAAALLAEAEAIYRDLGDATFVGKVWLQRAYLALAAGDVAGARALIEAGLARAEELGDRWSVAEQLDGLAAVLAAEGDAVGAAREAAAAEQVWESIGAAAQPADRRATDAWVSRAAAAGRPTRSG